MTSSQPYTAIMATRKPKPLALDRYASYRLHLITKLSDKTSATAYVEKLRLSLSEGRCLAAMGQYEPLSVQELARLANLNKANASRASDALAQRGIAVKSANQTDGRGVVLTLTPAGRTLWGQTMRLIQQRNEQIFSCLTPDELATFDKALDKIVGHLSTSDQPPD